MKPSIGVFIPTQGRRTLVRTLHSIATQQLQPNDRILVVGDGFNPWVRDIVPKFGPQFSYIPTKETNDWGHTQCNFGIARLKNTVDIITAQDDDDVFAPRAFERMRDTFVPNHLIMARVANHAWGLLWRYPRWGVPLVPNDPRYVGINAQDGHSPWLPGNALALPRFGPEYAGDQLYVNLSGKLFGARTIWSDTVTTLTRPDKMLGWRLFAWPVVDDDQWEALRVIRNTCAAFMTNTTDQISAEQQVAYRTYCNDKKIYHWLFAYPTNTPWEKPGASAYVGFARLDFTSTHVGITTYGLLPEHRNKGLGNEIIQYTLVAAQGPIEGEILDSNIASKKVHERLGCVIGPPEDGIVSFKSSWPPLFLDFDPTKYPNGRK